MTTSVHITGACDALRRVYTGACKNQVEVYIQHSIKVKKPCELRLILPDYDVLGLGLEAVNSRGDSKF